MTLQEALSVAESPVLRRLPCIVPEKLLNKAPEQYTKESFAALQKTLEGYAAGISFTARITLAREINEFCDEFHNYSFPKMCRLERIFDNTEMDILLLKELQGGSESQRYNQTQAERAAQFGMSTNAMQARIHSLEQGKEILGHHVKIEIDGRGRVAYDNTIHPVFCALNLKEAYFLTVELRRRFKGTPFEQLADDISADIYGQLSEYAKARLQPQIEEAGLEFEQRTPDALVNLREESRDAIFFLKSGIPCILQLMNGDSYTGRIRSGAAGLELEDSAGCHIAVPEDSREYTLRPAEA